MTQTPPYDVVVLGAGSGGYATALRGAELGLRTALVEADKVGGTCLHRGCIPTKALLHTAEVADAVRAAESVGVRAALDGIDLAAAHAYKDDVVRRLHTGLQGLLGARGVDVVAGWGTLLAPDTVAVGDNRLVGRHVVLATGSCTRTLPGLELGGRVLASDGALELDSVPGSVVVLGGGVIGVEMASMWRSLGAEVTVLEALPRLLPAEEEAISRALERAFRARGVDVVTSARVAGVAQDDDGVTVTTEDGRTHRADVLLVAVGRGPATAGLGYEAAGVELAGGHVATDERLRTGVAGVYAVGDLVRGPQLAHRGFAHGVFVAEDIAGLDPAPVVDEAIPRVTYSAPEVASVGLTEAEARSRHGDVEAVTYDLAGNGRSRILGTRGFVKLVRLPDGPVLGVHMIGSRVGELVGEAQAWVAWEAHPEDVVPLLHAHPTQSEALGEAAMALAGKPLHVHN